MRLSAVDLREPPEPFGLEGLACLLELCKVGFELLIGRGPKVVGLEGLDRRSQLAQRGT